MKYFLNINLIAKYKYSKANHKYKKINNKIKNVVKDKKVSNFILRYQVITDLPSKELRNIVDQGKKEINEGVIFAFSISGLVANLDFKKSIEESTFRLYIQ